MSDPKTTTATETPSSDFVLNLDAAPTGNLPVPATAAPATQLAIAEIPADGLTYSNATEEERAEMDKVKESIDLLDPETIVTLGTQSRQELATLSDKVLEGMDGQGGNTVIVAAQTIGNAITVLEKYSLAAIKRAVVGGGGLSKVSANIMSRFHGHDPERDRDQEMVEKLLKYITDSRIEIQEMTTKLTEQLGIMSTAFGYMNEMGIGFSKAGKELRIQNAGTLEFMRGIQDGENTTLVDLDTKAKSGRPDDALALHKAQISWNLLVTRVSPGLQRSISVYDMNINTLGIAQEDNYEKRLQLQEEILAGIPEWKGQLGMFRLVTQNMVAGNLIKHMDAIRAQAVKEGKNIFDMMMDMKLQSAGQINQSLRDVIDAQDGMRTKLAEVKTAMDAHIKDITASQKALAESSAHFNEDMRTVYRSAYMGSLPGTGPTRPADPPVISAPGTGTPQPGA